MAPKKPLGGFDKFASTKKPAKKASNKIAAKDITPDIKKAVDAVVNIKAKMKALKAEQDKSGLQIIEHVFPQQEAEAREGNYCKSFTVEGTDTTLTYTTIDKFSVPKEEAVQEEIRKLLGQKLFDKFFRMFRTVTFTEDAMQNEELVNDMIAVVEKHELTVPEVFTITDELATVKGMDEKQFELPKAKLAALRTLIKQYKATLK